MDPTATDKMFCQCSDYEVRPLMTQGPTPGSAFAPCAYNAPATITNSNPVTSSTQSIKEILATSTQDPSRASAQIVNLVSSENLISSPIPSGGIIIPLWGACSPGTTGTCIKGSRCICKDQWYSQCRVPIQGSYAPSDESWLCAQNNGTISANITTHTVGIPSAASSSSSIFHTISSARPTNIDSRRLPFATWLRSDASPSTIPSFFSSIRRRSSGVIPTQTLIGGLPVVTSQTRSELETLRGITTPFAAMTSSAMDVSSILSGPSFFYLPSTVSSPQINIPSLIEAAKAANAKTLLSSSYIASPTATVPSPQINIPSLIEAAKAANAKTLLSSSYIASPTATVPSPQINIPSLIEAVKATNTKTLLFPSSLANPMTTSSTPQINILSLIEAAKAANTKTPPFSSTLANPPTIPSTPQVNFLSLDIEGARVVSTNTLPFLPPLSDPTTIITSYTLSPTPPAMAASLAPSSSIIAAHVISSSQIQGSLHPGPSPASTASFECPLPAVVDSTSRNQGSAPHVVQRDNQATCDLQSGNTISNLSSTSKTPSGQAISPSSGIDPDTNGSYMQAGATPEQQTQCSNIAAHQLQACWVILNVTGYIMDWTAFNQKTCDENSMGFADCFLYIEQGGGANCSSFTGRSQCPVPDVRSFAGKTHAAQVYYVAFNIWNIQNWFFTYWMAIEGANVLTSDNVGAICRLLNIPLPKPFPLLEVLAVMAFALGLISPSGWGAEIPVLGEKARNALTAIQVPGEYLLRGVQGSPTLARNLLTTGDLTQTEVQITQIESGIALIVSQLQYNIQSAILGVMGNFTLFMDFVSDGFFSTQIEDLNTIQQNITKALQTYVVSQALQDDKVIITRALDTDVHALATNGSYLAYDIGCTQGYDEWGMCNNWWYDSENNISYGLESGKDMTLNYTTVLEDLFNQGIITPDLLFRGSQVCADASGSTQGNAPGTSLSTSIGVWNAECISNMKICTWELGIFSQQHEYSDCPYEPDFALEGCGEGTDVNQAKVPINYIGPWLLSGEFEGIVCNS